MRLQGHGSRARPGGVMLLAVGLLCGCASPGAPKPPSLQMPETVQDLTLARIGNVVRVRFSVPSRTTDGVPLHGPVEARLCRQAAAGAACTAVDAAELGDAAAYTAALHPGQAVAWTDHLPSALTEGAARAAGFRVELRNAAGRAAGYSDAVYAAAGAAPPEVADFRGEGTRLGVLLQWTPVAGAGEVLLERRQLNLARAPASAAPARPSAGPGAAKKPGLGGLGGESRKAKAEPGMVTLQAEPGNAAAARTLDASVVEGERYRYQAERRVRAQVGGRTLELLSGPSAAVEIVWRDVYPPAAPQGLTAVGFAVPGADPAAAGYAVDLVWQPVADPRVSGYVVQRVRLGAAGEPVGEPAVLTPEPVATPGFHDATAMPGVRYRYEVAAVDARGNRSAAAAVSVGD